MRPMMTMILAIVAMTAAGAAMAASQLSDAEVRRRIIQQSIAAYPGPCPCPYNVMRNGRPCGTNSAYSKPGGRSPVCYERDVTAAMVREFRARMGR